MADDVAELASCGPLDGRDPLDRARYRAQALAEATGDEAGIARRQTLGSHDPDDKPVERFLDDLPLLNTRQTDEDPVESDGLAAVRADDRVFEPADQLVQDRHG